MMSRASSFRFSINGARNVAANTAVMIALAKRGREKRWAMITFGGSDLVRSWKILKLKCIVVSICEFWFGPDARHCKSVSFLVTPLISTATCSKSRADSKLSNIGYDGSGRTPFPVRWEVHSFGSRTKRATGVWDMSTDLAFWFKDQSSKIGKIGK